MTTARLHEPGRLGQRDPLRPAGQDAEIGEAEGQNKEVIYVTTARLHEPDRLGQRDPLRPAGQDAGSGG